MVSVFEKFGGIRPMARKLGDLPWSTVMSWQRSQKIPAWRHQSILEAAERHGIALDPHELINIRPDKTTAPERTTSRGAAA